MSLEDVGHQVRQGHEPTRFEGTLEPADDKLPLGRADLTIFEGLFKVSQMFSQRLLVLFELLGPNASPFLLDLTPRSSRPLYESFVLLCAA